MLQHTKDPKRAFYNLVRYLKRGGKIAIDCYLKDGKIREWKSKYLWRWLTRRMPHERLWKIVEWYVPKWLVVDEMLRKMGKPAYVFRCIIPCFNWSDRSGLSKGKIINCSVLDTFDALSAYYDFPQRICDVKKWFEDMKFTKYEVFEGSNGLVGRATKI